MGTEKSSLLPVSVPAPQSKDIDMSIVAPGIDVGLATIFMYCQTLDGFAVTLRGRQQDGVSRGSTSYPANHQLSCAGTPADTLPTKKSRGTVSHPSSSQLIRQTRICCLPQYLTKTYLGYGQGLHQSLALRDLSHL